MIDVGAQSPLSGHVAAYRDVEKTGGRAEPDDPRMVLGETYTRASRCSGGISAKAGVNTVPVFSQLPPFYREKKTTTTHPAFCWVATVFFPPHKMAAVLSAAWQSRSVLGARRDGGKSLWVCPAPSAPQRRAHLALVMVRKSSFAPVNGEQPCGLKKRRGCHRNARLSP